MRFEGAAPIPGLGGACEMGKGQTALPRAPCPHAVGSAPQSHLVTQKELDRIGGEGESHLLSLSVSPALRLALNYLANGEALE